MKNLTIHTFILILFMAFVIARGIVFAEQMDVTKEEKKEDFHTLFVGTVGLTDVTGEVKKEESVRSVLPYLPFFPPLPFVSYNKIQFAKSEYIIHREGFWGTGEVKVEMNETVVSKIATKGLVYSIIGLPLFGGVFGFVIGRLAVRSKRSLWAWALTFGGLISIGYALTLMMIVKGFSLTGAIIASLTFGCWVGSFIFLAFGRIDKRSNSTRQAG